MRKVSLDMLTADMQLGKAVCKGASILISSGTKDLTRYIPRLQRLGLTHLYIQDDSCDDIEMDEIVCEHTRMECKQTIEKSFRQMQAQSTVDVRQVSFVVEDLLDEILGHSNMLVSLNEIGGIGDNTLDHSLNTTIYAICLGTQLGYNREQLRHLACGTLLHDVGKTMLNNTILFKQGPLQPDEFEHVKQHAQIGYNMLSKHSNISEASKRIALCHHERVDGSGYPGGLMGDQLSEFTRIAAIVDVFEALTVNRCYHRAIAPQHAVDVLCSEAGIKLDMRLCTLFMQSIAIYPNGMTVLLSDGRYAVVKQQNRALPLRPVVRVLTIENGKCVAQEEINLMQMLNITIVDSDLDLLVPPQPLV